MAKRKCEQPLVALLPPCKRPVYSRHCTSHTMQVSPKGKRKLEPETIPSPECDRTPPQDGAPAAAQPSCKKPRPAESHGAIADTAYQCQKDEAFSEYNSFHFWRTPLPDIDFSELVDGVCDGDKQTTSAGTDVLEEMDN
ncbi:uncharacterized protein C9orf40 homolog [Anomaloglossus baeobatrachus]|uniref:uncharacterized protein C9orf40 homolog n=1 Tax=Anomaloglossus baeobatrachus TaxID=238106 RepID=UPI003F4F912E